MRPTRPDSTIWRAVPPLPTTDRVVALAPDAAALKAGRELAQPRRWALLGGDDVVLFGLASGSGKEPYQVQVLLADLATKCSCPSRKFPCKHALGLLFIAAESPDRLVAGERPAWVVEWLASREERARAARTRAENESKGAVVDAAAQRKRRDVRTARAVEGVQLLEQWLADLVQRGLVDPQSRTREAWLELERRMVDAQVPGLAARVARTAELVVAGGDELTALAAVGRLHLVARAVERRAELAPEHASGLSAALGWPSTNDDAASQVTVDDRWFVAARAVVERERLVTTTSWLFGAATGQWVLHSQSEPLHQRRGDTLPLGRTLAAALVVQRDRPVPRGTFEGEPTVVPGPAPLGRHWHDVIERHASALTSEPWHERTPFLANVRPAEVEGSRHLVDDDGAALPWRAHFDDVVSLEAVGGGAPLLVAGVWDGRAVVVLALSCGESWLATRSSEL